MKELIAVARMIEALNERIGHYLYWLIFIAVSVSAANAVIRYPFNASSNAWLEIQWYIFLSVFLFCADHALPHNRNAHLDTPAGRFSPRTQAWIDILAIAFVLVPVILLLVRLAGPVLLDGYQRSEPAGSDGDLVVWPARLLIPVGFVLLSLQCLSELTKRIAFLARLTPHAGVRDSRARAGLNPKLDV